VAEQLEQAAATVRAAAEGTRNETLFRQSRAMGRLVARGEATEEDVVAALHAAGLASGLGDTEVRRTVGSGIETGLRSPERFMRTDYGNAERLVRDAGEDLRFCPPRKSWLVWNGGRWCLDESGEVMRRAKQTVRQIFAEARDIPDDDAREKLMNFAAASEHRPRLEATIFLAQSEADLVVLPDELDAEPMLLNCKNGTVDLRTGELRPPSRADLLTRQCPVDYDPAATLEEWDSFLDQVTDGDQEMIAFLRKAAGYSLTGLPMEEVLFFLYGPAATGKSTFVDALRCCLGGTSAGYATTADFETFLKRQFGGGVRNDLARLAGTRLVFSSEVEDGKELAEGVVKALTGGDTITARFLYREFFEYVPQFTLWFVANHQPRVAPDDEAMWRRIRVVPFTHVVPERERNPKLKALLRDPAKAGPAVLAWAVQGCLEWQREGLGEPPAVRAATAAYRADMDPYAGFVGEGVVAAPGSWVRASDLRERALDWVTARGLGAVLPGRKVLAGQLKAIGATSHRRTGQHGWLGIALVETDTPVPDEQADSGAPETAGSPAAPPSPQPETSRGSEEASLSS
jgi:putative DNA primase/helicase